MGRVGPGGAGHVEMPGLIQTIVYRGTLRGAAARFLTEPLTVRLRKQSGGTCRRNRQD